MLDTWSNHLHFSYADWPLHKRVWVTQPGTCYEALLVPLGVPLPAWHRSCNWLRPSMFVYYTDILPFLWGIPCTELLGGLSFCHWLDSGLHSSGQGWCIWAFRPRIINVSKIEEHPLLKELGIACLEQRGLLGWPNWCGLETRDMHHFRKGLAWNTARWGKGEAEE